jgi:hypothetical protein
MASKTSGDAPDASAAKKRGRKPRGGKIVATQTDGLAVPVPTPNVILHLKCGLADLQGAAFSPIAEPVPAGASTDDTGDKLGFKVIETRTPGQCGDTNAVVSVDAKLQELARALHTNNIPGKKSACFWCTCDFDNPPIFIPKFSLGGTHYCYGCFCSPECGAAHLFREPIDTATRFERYALLNHLYCKIYDYTMNIKPAPDPFHTLDKYYGNLSIQEYRQHLKSERILLVVDKPMSRLLPEIHEDNDEFSRNSRGAGGGFRLRRSRKKPTKAEMLVENFNMK